MRLRDRISLIWNYAKGIFVIGGVFNIVCAYYLALSFSYTGFVEAFILKVFVMSLSFYLVTHLEKRDSVFFFINLGLSRRKMYIAALLADFLILAILLTIVLIAYGT
ncbi:MAG: hypothetical protein J6O51_06655 [Bacteroidales bacterium]|nr:hypothetical protein [Bacteroidales bacterium]